MVKIERFTEEDAKKTPEEIFSGISADEPVLIKDMPNEDKIRFLRYVLTYDGLINASLLTNVTFLIYGKNIEDEVFADERIVFNNLEEYVDAKYDLKAEIDEYAKNILKFYFAALKSYGLILNDGKIDIPGSYKAILQVSETADISKLMNKYSFDTKDVPLVFDAETIVNSFRIMESPIIKDFMDSVMESLKK